MRRSLPWLLSLFVVLFLVVVAQPQNSSTFTYQGHLSEAGSPAHGSYDFEFSLFDQAALGNQVESTLSRPAVQVSNGLFTVELDFGAGSFAGQPRWLEIAVQPSGGGGFTVLAPRQELTSAPGALYAVTARTINGLECEDGEVARWNAGSWTCGMAGAGTVTSVSTGQGLTGGPITDSGTIEVAALGITPGCWRMAPSRGPRSRPGRLGPPRSTPLRCSCASAVPAPRASSCVASTPMAP